MAFAHVQASATNTVSAVATPVNNITLTFGSPVSSGSLVAGGVCFDITIPRTINSITDDKGNNYTPERVDDTGDNEAAASFFLGNITNGPTVITITFSGTTSAITAIADEYSGGFAATDPRDGATHQGNYQPTPGTGANAVTSGTAVTTATNGDLIYGVGFQTGAVGGTLNAGTSYTQRGHIAATTNVVAGESEDLVQGSAGSAQVTMTNVAASATVCFIIAFKPAATQNPFVQSNWQVPGRPGDIIRPSTFNNIVNQQTNQTQTQGPITGSQCL